MAAKVRLTPAGIAGPKLTSSGGAMITSTQYPSYALVGTGTSWTGSPFSVVSGPATILRQDVISTTSAYLIMNANGATSIPMTDGTNNFTLTVAASGAASNIYVIDTGKFVRVLPSQKTGITIT